MRTPGRAEKAKPPDRPQLGTASVRAQATYESDATRQLCLAERKLHEACLSGGQLGQIGCFDKERRQRLERQLYRLQGKRILAPQVRGGSVTALQQHLRRRG